MHSDTYVEHHHNRKPLAFIICLTALKFSCYLPESKEKSVIAISVNKTQMINVDSHPINTFNYVLKWGQMKMNWWMHIAHTYTDIPRKHLHTIIIVANLDDFILLIPFHFDNQPKQKKKHECLTINLYIIHLFATIFEKFMSKNRLFIGECMPYAHTHYLTHEHIVNDGYTNGERRRKKNLFFIGCALPIH